MTMFKLVAVVLLVVIGSMLITTSGWCQSGLIETALKVFGISYVVRRFGSDINSFVNRLAGQRGVQWEGVTKVVPIFSVGQGAYVGAAQVQGARDRIAQTRGVAQIEARLGGGRGRLLVPVDTTNPTADPDRVPGVGVSALIDFRI